jgi:hypothetical protein
MAKVQSIKEIGQAWKAEGRTYRVGDLVDEQKRQGRENLRELESNILAVADLPGGEHLREVAEQIRDHRDAGHYTTQG